MEKVRVRPPAVAGQFYPSSPTEVRRQIEASYLHRLGPGALPQVKEEPLKGPIGLVLPHAGYVYSGPTAARGLFELASRGHPNVVVVLGPNHYGLGPSAALSEAPQWQTPLGTAALAKDLARELQKLAPRLQPSDLAHRYEHSIEVILPFLHHLYGEGPRLLPISLLDQSIEPCVELGKTLAQLLRGERAAVIASSDLSHYHPQEDASQRDHRAIEAMLTLQPGKVARAIKEGDINMCGPGPVMAMLACMEALGASRVRLLGYSTSGDTSGDLSAVVGYAALLVE